MNEPIKVEWIFKAEMEEIEKILGIKLTEDQKCDLEDFFLKLQEDIEDSVMDNRDTEPIWDINDLD